MRHLTPGRSVGAFLVAVTVAVDPAGLSPFGPAKWLVVSAGLLAVAAVVAASDRPVAADRTVVVALLAVTLLAALAAVAGVDDLYAWVGTPQRHWGVVAWVLVVLAFVAGSSVRSTELPAVGVAAVAAAGVCGIWAAAEAVGWSPLELAGVSGRPGGPFGSSAYLGAAAALLVPITAGCLAAAADTIGRTSAAAAAVAGLFALVASGARAAWLGVGLTALTWFVVRRPKLSLRLAAAVATAVVGAAIATGAVGRAAAVADDDAGGIRGRLDEWRIAARAVAAHPLLGSGPEGYRIDFAEHVDEAYERRHGRDPLPDRAHAAPLDVAATAGIPAALAHLLAMAVVALHCVRTLRHDGGVKAGIAAGVLAYLTQSLFLFPIAELDVAVWLLAGTVSARELGGTPGSGPRGRRPVVAVASALALAAAVAGAVGVVADRRAARALDDVGTDPSMGLAAAELRPDVIDYRIVAARWFERQRPDGRYDEAITQLELGLDVSPRDPILHRERNRLLLDRARLTKRAGDVDAAVAALRTAAVDDPRNGETQLRLGLALALAGDDAGAIAAWHRADRLAPSSGAAATNLAITYARQGRTDEARAAARRALARDPGSSRAQHVLDQLDGT